MIRNAAFHLMQSLNRSQRNSLRVLLLKRDGLSELRDALGVRLTPDGPVPVADQEPYDDLLPLDRAVEAGSGH